MKPGFIIDLCLMLILLMAAGAGARRGLIMTASKLVSLTAGYIGAWRAALALSKPIGNRFFLPWVNDSIIKAAAESYNPVNDVLNQAADLGAGAEATVMEALSGLGLPAFSISGVFGTLLDKVTGTGRDVLSAAAEIISQRIAFVLIFIVAFIIIQLAVLFASGCIEGLTSLPLMGPVNRIGGALCGALLAAFIALALLWVLGTFFPSLTADHGILSEEALKGSRLLPLFLKAVKKVLP